MALYDDAVKLATGFIGPMGQKFIDRQLATHLSIGPAQLTHDKLAELSKWCLASARLVIDEKQATTFSEKILALK
jgi:hypothetical protein